MPLIDIVNRLNSLIELAVVRARQPAIVKLDRQLPVSNRPLEAIVDRIHDVAAKVAIEGPNDAQWQPFVGKTRADLFQPLQPLKPFLA
ncbi:MAG TPA: hypothetical protein PLS67_09465 [Accumulibacter sp.]|jgi:hypothetical protein|nr:hypothetical protein [Accumulibacter sp.]HQC80727.1 hypothetical protein [Accumulibacter sp.]